MAHNIRLRKALVRLGNKFKEARTLRSQGRYDEAEILQRRILNETVRLRGSKDRATLRAVEEITSTLWCRSRYVKAGNAQRTLMGMFEKHFGPNDIDTHSFTSLLITTYVSQHEYQKAEELASKWLSDQQRMYECMYPNALDTQDKLASISHMKGEFQRAAAMRPDLLNQRQRRIDIDKPRPLGTAFRAHAQSLMTLDKANQSMSFLQKAINIHEISLGPGHVDTLSCKAQLAMLYYVEGRYKKAVEVGHKVLTLREKILGTTHPETIGTMSDQAAYLMLASLREESEREIDRAVKLSRKYLGDNNFDTLSILSNAASIYIAMGRWDTAKELACLSLNSSRRLKGADHSQTLDALSTYCHCLWQQRDLQIAIDNMRLCVSHTRQKYTDDHFLTLKRAKELAEMEKHCEMRQEESGEA